MAPHLPNKMSCLSPKEIEVKLRESGVNPTAQRLAICRYVLCEADHPTAEQVKEWADRNFPMMSLATVYNTLRVLVEAGLVREFRLPHSESVIYDSTTSDHYHFLDEATGKLYDLSTDEVQVVSKLSKRKFKINSIDLVLKGEV